MLRHVTWPALSPGEDGKTLVIDLQIDRLASQRLQTVGRDLLLDFRLVIQVIADGIVDCRDSSGEDGRG